MQHAWTCNQLSGGSFWHWIEDRFKMFKWHVICHIFINNRTILIINFYFPFLPIKSKILQLKILTKEKQLLKVLWLQIFSSRQNVRSCREQTFNICAWPWCLCQPSLRTVLWGWWDQRGITGGTPESSRPPHQSPSVSWNFHSFLWRLRSLTAASDTMLDIKKWGT